MSETFETPEELIAYQRETARMATETERLANTNWANIVPWRYFRWRRVHKQVKAELAEINRRADVGEMAFRKFFGRPSGVRR